ncbi:hypothetical protein DPMN_051364 [Dreissena polymorpha]|uniref:Uncharacterized protein n=1 Tax=Dreissena polymorpha TaxID=45954 RepID=A0A9D4CHQ6_DREPO|nr:hypothetical protein DPMN_051364 [Dreissena polymorpha]
MVKSGNIEEASLCKDVRDCWRAEDEPGIPAADRVHLRMPLRRRLLSRLDVGTFPPPGVYVRGWPSQFWETILANIDAKTQLYSLVRQKSYNTRAFSSLVGETFFLELTLYDRRGHGTVSASEFQSFTGTAIEKLHMRFDKER